LAATARTAASGKADTEAVANVTLALITGRSRHPGLDPGPAFLLLNAHGETPTVYLLATGSHGTFYTGVTSKLVGRIWQHRTETTEGFTAVYGIKRLVWFEVHDTMHAAITRQKQIKRWARAWKYDLVNAFQSNLAGSCRGPWLRTITARRKACKPPGQARADVDKNEG